MFTLKIVILLFLTDSGLVPSNQIWPKRLNLPPLRRGHSSKRLVQNTKISGSTGQHVGDVVYPLFNQ